VFGSLLKNRGRKALSNLLLFGKEIELLGLFGAVELFVLLFANSLAEFFRFLFLLWSYSESKAGQLGVHAVYRLQLGRELLLHFLDFFFEIFLCLVPALFFLAGELTLLHSFDRDRVAATAQNLSFIFPRNWFWLRDKWLGVEGSLQLQRSRLLGAHRQWIQI